MMFMSNPMSGENGTCASAPITPYVAKQLNFVSLIWQLYVQTDIEKLNRLNKNEHWRFI